MNAIWRPTSSSDLGIDGQIEFLEEGTSISTGKLVAVQVKSGPSYFASVAGECAKYYADGKHRQYWSRLTLPVILVLHNPDNGTTVYARVKSQLQGDNPIMVPLHQTFDAAARSALLLTCAEDAPYPPPGEIADAFHRVVYDADGSTQLNGIHFLLATVAPEFGYFELRMARIIRLLELMSHSTVIALSNDVYDFILRCVLKVIAAGVTESFLEEFERAWYDLHMVPDIAVPLTGHGIAVMEHVWADIERFVDPTTFVGLEGGAYQVARAIARETYEESLRLDASDRLGEVPR